MVSQVASGFVLLSLISCGTDIGFDFVMMMTKEHYHVLLTRQLHMLLPNSIMAGLYLHIGKAGVTRLTSTVRSYVWVTGSLLLLLTLGACFTGYILVTGNMSYWALIVILNIVTVIPLADIPIVGTLLSGPVPSSTSLRRMMTLHYLLGLVVLALIMLHITYVHRLRPGTSHNQIPRVAVLGDILAKDLIFLLPVVLLACIPALTGAIHPDNWYWLNPGSTPPHIEPEVYFLWLFCVLKSRASKLVGAISLIGISIVASNVQIRRSNLRYF